MISLTEPQARGIHQAASETVAAGVLRRPARLADATLGGAAEQVVLGVFVSLKRGGRGDLHRLADDLQFEVDDLLPLVDGA
jgi:hypothetical protein